jgi:hypothetical protein
MQTWTGADTEQHSGMITNFEITDYLTIKIEFS